MADHEQIMLMLGQIQGQLEGVTTQLGDIKKSTDSLGKRMNKVEIKAAVNGAVSGGLIATGISLLTLSIREAFRSGGS